MSNFPSEAEYLRHYNIHDFEVPLCSVDMAIFTVQQEQLQVLLVKRAQFPAREKWSLPGGFIDLRKDKMLVDAASRKLKEKTGVDTPYLEQVETIGNAKRDPRGWSLTVVYMALLPGDNLSLQHDESSEQIAWFSLEEAVKMRLAFDHNQLLQLCHERLQNKVLYTSLPVNLLPREFTLTELQSMYEIVMGKAVEKKSFRRRMEEADILEQTGKLRSGSNRPARLYRVKKNGTRYYFPRNMDGAKD